VRKANFLSYLISAFHPLLCELWGERYQRTVARVRDGEGIFPPGITGRSGPKGSSRGGVDESFNATKFHSQLYLFETALARIVYRDEEGARTEIF
jgi:hypothetical protein